MLAFHDKISPNYCMQEKVTSFVPYYMNYGHGFFELLIQESTLFEDNYTILTEQD